MQDTEIIKSTDSSPSLDKGIQKAILRKIPPEQIPVYLLYSVCVIALGYIVFADISLIKGIVIIVIVSILGYVVREAMKFVYSRKE